VNLIQWCGGDVNDLMQSGWMGWAWGGFGGGRFFF
jgi:hypothetical protein